MFRSEVYRQLPPEAARIREEVFVREQGFEVEFDDVDDHAYHMLLFEDDVPVGVCRFFWDDEKGAYMIGRVAVSKEHRGRSIGSVIMCEAERNIAAMGGHMVMLSSQVRASGFYGKQGYTAFGDEYMDEFCPHIMMRKDLD